MLLTACGARVESGLKAVSGESPVTAMLKANKLDGKVVLVGCGRRSSAVLRYAAA